LRKDNRAPCHSEAGFIGEESAFCRRRKQQIPRAILPRFGMTILWDRLKGDFITATSKKKNGRGRPFSILQLREHQLEARS
jgi:hypothetical protein